MSGDLGRILDELRRESGDAYHVWYDEGTKRFGALPRNGPISDPLYADTAEGLLQLVRQDDEKEHRSGSNEPDVAEVAREQPER